MFRKMIESVLSSEQEKLRKSSMHDRKHWHGKTFLYDNQDSDRFPKLKIHV